MGQAWSLPEGLRRGPQLGKEQQLQAATWARADIPARNNAAASQGRAIGDTCRQMERETRVSTWCDRERHLDHHPCRHQMTERKRQVMNRVPEGLTTIKSPNDSPRPQGLGADPGRSHHHGA